MKRFLYLHPGTMQVAPHVGSLYQISDSTCTVNSFDFFVPEPDEAILHQALHYDRTHVIWLGVCGGPYEPCPGTFRTLRNHGIKTIALIPEASHPDWDRLIQRFHGADSFDLIVNLDGNKNWNDRGKGLTTLAIFDQRPYENVGTISRVHDVGFCGGSGGPGTMRERLISHLKHVGLLTEFPFNETRGTYQSYADFMMSCKIIVNAAGSAGDRSKHVKGRVIEAGLAGCCLLEEAGSPIHEWFSYNCFFTYDSPEDCEKQIRVLLNYHPDGITRRAEALSREVRTKYSPRVLWDQVLANLF